MITYRLQVLLNSTFVAFFIFTSSTIDSISAHLVTRCYRPSIQTKMAILEHFSACILIDGTPCQEYAVDEDEDQSDESSEEYPEVTKYVEVVAGAQFAVRIQPLKSFDFGKGDCISVPYFSDGKCIVNQLQLKAQVKAKNILNIRGKRVGDGSDICPFKFGNIPFSELP